MYLSIENAFSDRKYAFCLDHSLMTNISKAFIDASVDSNQFSPVYKVSSEWVPIVSKYLQGIMGALTNCDVSRIHHSYSNFFRDECSTGLHGLHFEMVERYMSGPISSEDQRIYMDACLNSAKLAILSNPGLDFSELVKPDVGNPYEFEIVSDGSKRHFVDASSLIHFTTARRIMNLLEQHNHRKVICELGGGFGGMAYYLLRNKNIKYVGFDLPVNIALQTFYLKSHYPELKIKTYTSSDKDQVINLSEFDILLYPSFMVERMPNLSADLVYNSYSLAELSSESVNNYVKHLCRISSNFFYHINHTFWRISSDSFPIPNEEFNLLFRYPTMWGKDPYKPSVDEHEFLYQRRFKI